MTACSIARPLICGVLLLLSFAPNAQDLHQVVQVINPALFLNDENNQRVYRQSVMNRNHLIFSRGFYYRPVEQREESYHYSFLNERCRQYVLERKFNRYDFHIGLQTMPSNDFGIKVYRLMNDDQWVEVTEEVLPNDFQKRLLSAFPDLEPSGHGHYYYNILPTQQAEMLFEHRCVHFKKQGRTILGLRWKRNQFIWH